jgi:2'-5' RNA ligase
MSNRLFLAIPLSKGIKNAIIERQSIIDKALNWIPAANLHITLHFLGNTHEEKIPIIIERISEVIQSSHAFNLYIKEISTESGKFQNMVWVKFISSPEFIKLSREIAKTLGASLTRNPRPHINLIRLKDKNYFLNNPPLPMILNEEIKVKQVELWKSILRGSKHPEYISLHRFILHESAKK